MGIIKKIKEVEYRINPMGVEMPWIEGESPITVVEKINSIPKIERKAISPDLTRQDHRQALDSPVDYIRNRLKTDLLYLLNAGLEFHDISPKVKYQKMMADFYKQKASRILVLIPREHFKTTFTQGLIVQWLLNDPNITIMLRSNTWRNATTILDVIEKRIRNPNISAFFGDLIGDQWSRDAMNIATRTEHTREPNVFATGIGSDVTGLHPKKGIFDDVQSEDNYDTAEGRKRVKDDYEYCLFVVTEDIVMNATRWDELDLTGHLIEKNKSYPPGHEKRYEILKMGVYDELGEPIFPLTYRTNPPSPMYDKNWIESKRLELGAYKFSAQMLNEPISSEDQVFSNEDMHLYDVLPADLMKRLNYFITDDPGSGIEKYTDETAIIVCGVDEIMNIYVVDCVIKRMSISEQVNELWKKMIKWNPKLTGIEKGTLEKALKKPLKDRMKFQQRYFSLRPLKYGDQPGAMGISKTARIASLQPYFEAGMIHIRKDMHKLQDQLLKWRPYKNSRDDGVDALAYQLQLIYTPAEIKPIKSKTPFQRWLERKRGGHKGQDFDIKFLNEEAI